MSRSETLSELLFKSDGRMGRKTFALINLAIFGIWLVFGVAMNVSEAIESDGLFIGSIALFMIYLVVGFVVELTVTAKRLHDLDKPTAWILLSFVPGINVLHWIALLLTPGTDGPNRFGPKPGCVTNTEGSRSGVGVNAPSAKPGVATGIGQTVGAVAPTRRVTAVADSFPRCAECQAITLDVTAPCPACGAEAMAQPAGQATQG